MNSSARVALWFAAATLLSGCSLGPGALPGLLIQGDGLTPEARRLRKYPGELDLLSRELDKRVLPSYVVEPGDVLLVQPLDLDSPIRLPGDQPIFPDGSINLGRFGRPIVAGRTVEEIEAIIRAAVGEHYRDTGYISVRLVTRQSKIYYVLGEVNAPGAFQLMGRETALDAILAAGGLTDRAAENNIILARPTGPNCDRVVLPVCYTDIVQVGDTTSNYQIAPGDRIFVPTKGCLESLLHHDKKKCTACTRTSTLVPPAEGGWSKE